MDVENLINSIKKRPQMYIGDLSIDRLALFISGFLYSNRMNNRNYDMDRIFKSDIHEWTKQAIKEKEGIKFKLHMDYSYYIKEVCENGEQEIALFFELSEQFFKEKRWIDYDK